MSDLYSYKGTGAPTEYKPNSTTIPECLKVTAPKDITREIDMSATTVALPNYSKCYTPEGREVNGRGFLHTNSYTNAGVYYAGMLTGSQIAEEIKNKHISISDFDPTKINPNSYNLTLNNTLLTYKDDVIDFKKANPTNKIIIPDSGLILYPNKLYLGKTNEVCWTDRFIPMLNGRSSIGRLGICIHITAGFGDIGFNGTWTLEITAAHPVRIYPNIEICQISYFTPFGETNIQYDGRYQGQSDVTASRSNLEKKVYMK